MSNDDISIELSGQFGYQHVLVHSSQVLGSGSHGSVVMATLDHLPCAAKILHPIYLSGTEHQVKNFAAHIEEKCKLLRDLKHPSIVQFLGLVQDHLTQRPILLMELMEESLTSFLDHSSTPVPYHIQVDIVQSIALALAYLHNNHIIHKDLSSNNVLINAGSQAKVTDFSMSKIADITPSKSHGLTTQFPGVLVFMPPEALRPKPRYTDKVDTFSTGVLTIQTITRNFPSPTDSEMILDDPTAPTGEKIVLIPEVERRKHDISQVPSTHPLLPIACSCLKDHGIDRPSATQLCQSLAKLKTSSEYEESIAVKQRQTLTLSQTTASLKEQQREVDVLKQQLRLKEEEKQAEQQSKGTEIRELKHQLRTLKATLQRDVASSCQKVGITCNTTVTEV